MCEALAVTVVQGSFPREEAARFLQAAYSDLGRQKPRVVWVGWQSAIAILALTELVPLVRDAFARGFIPSDEMKFENFERNLRHAIEHPENPYGPMVLETQLWTNTVAEFSKWAGFEEQEPETERGETDTLGEDLMYPLDRRELRDSAFASETVVKPHRHVGRNDPCPCGSGKRFKKCCWEKTRQ
jgi:hypothetical protein